MKRPTLIISLLLGAVMFTSCSTYNALMGTNYGTVVGPVTEGVVKRQFRVQLIECIGNASAQSVTAMIAITNMGPNAHLYIGGNSDGSMAVDEYGVTSKPYNSAGVHYDLPSGVTVRAEVDRINPVRPGAAMFQTLRISIGSGNKDNIVDFRNVPIVWEN